MFLYELKDVIDGMPSKVAVKEIPIKDDVCRSLKCSLKIVIVLILQLPSRELKIPVTLDGYSNRYIHCTKFANN